MAGRFISTLCAMLISSSALNDTCAAVNNLLRTRHGQNTLFMNKKMQYEKTINIAPLSANNMPLSARTDSGSIGLQYKEFYVGAHVDTYTALKPTLERIRQYNEYRGAHLVSGGIRIGGFLNQKTLIYVKAGFLNTDQRSEHPLNKPDDKHSLRTSTSFTPAIGFEWQLPQKISIAGEIRTAFDRRTISPLKSRKQNGAVLFNIRYQLDKNGNP